MVVCGEYGRDMVETAEVMVGSLDVKVVESGCHLGGGEIRERVRQAVERATHGQKQVLLVTDLCGSTQANVCMEFLSHHRGWEMVTGLNLPMLMKLATCDRTLSPGALAQRLRSTGGEAIKLGRAYLPDPGGDRE